MYVQYSVQPQGEQVRGLVLQESSPMTFKHFVPLQESKTDPLLHLAQTLRVIEEFVSFQFSEKVILKFTLKKKKSISAIFVITAKPISSYQLHTVSFTYFQREVQALICITLTMF